MIRTFALVYGIVFIATGVAGFIPGFVVPDQTGMETQTAQFGEGLLLGLFPTNAIHNIFHLLWGVWGVLSVSDARRAWIYAAVTAAVYLLLSAVGWAWGLNTALGMMPLHGNDVWLHLGLGLVALAAALTTHGAWRESVPRQPGETRARPDQRGAVDPKQNQPRQTWRTQPQPVPMPQTGGVQQVGVAGYTEAGLGGNPPQTPGYRDADPHGTVRPDHDQPGRDKPGHDKHRVQGSY